MSLYFPETIIYFTLEYVLRDWRLAPGLSEFREAVEDEPLHRQRNPGTIKPLLIPYIFYNLHKVSFKTSWKGGTLGKGNVLRKIIKKITEKVPR